MPYNLLLLPWLRSCFCCPRVSQRREEHGSGLGNEAQGKPATGTDRAGRRTMGAHTVFRCNIWAGLLPVQPSTRGFDDGCGSTVLLDRGKSTQRAMFLALLTDPQSILSMIYVLSHCLLSRKLCSAGLRRPAKTKLDSACSHLPRLLMLLWIVATAMDLIVASRRPTCLPDSRSTDSWSSGLGCRMHRAIAGLSVLAL